jgi:hypothetical protein
MIRQIYARTFLIEVRKPRLSHFTRIRRGKPSRNESVHSDNAGLSKSHGAWQRPAANNSRYSRQFGNWRLTFASFQWREVHYRLLKFLWRSKDGRANSNGEGRPVGNCDPNKNCANSAISWIERNQRSNQRYDLYLNPSAAYFVTRGYLQRSATNFSRGAGTATPLRTTPSPAGQLGSTNCECQDRNSRIIEDAATFLRHSSVGSLWASRQLFKGIRRRFYAGGAR